MIIELAQHQRLAHSPGASKGGTMQETREDWPELDITGIDSEAKWAEEE
jgi:hypothetical protein